MAAGGTGIHVGLIGAGRIGAFHLRTLASLEDVAGLTVTDADPQRAESVAAGARHAVAPSPEALVEAGVDAIVIATPNARPRRILSGMLRILQMRGWREEFIPRGRMICRASQGAARPLARRFATMAARFWITITRVDGLDRTNRNRLPSGETSKLACGFAVTIDAAGKSAVRDVTASVGFVAIVAAIIVGSEAASAFVGLR